MNDKKQKIIKIIGLIALISVIISQSNIMSVNALNIQPESNISQNILKIPIDLDFLSPISIDGNSELESSISNKRLSGDGTSTSPYIIENRFMGAIYGNGIEIKNSEAYYIIRNCTIVGGFPHGNDGIYLERASNVKITNNTIINNNRGIFMRTSCYNNVISKNIIKTTYSTSEFTNGIILAFGCDNNTIMENYVNNTYWGITISDSDNAIISDNIATFNSHGIELNNHCYNCTISGNNVSNNSLGINLFADCCDNVIFGNNISYNYRLGIEIDNDSNYNLIYFNDIYGNVKGQAEEQHESIGNKWDNGTTGNYWGDYSDKYPNARNNSVFWKTPYEIDGNDLGVDNYPLVNPISVYTPSDVKKISGFPIVNILIFIYVGMFLLRRRISHLRIRR